LDSENRNEALINFKSQGWKISVEARQFVLTLRDYFEEQYERMDPVNVYLSQTPSTVLKETEDFALATAFASANQKASDMLAFQYINITGIRPILEAFDDDYTGFVSIREANQLLLSKPKDWRFVCTYHPNSCG
jgi:isocitrate dehydrogenase kinase/phosphatase